jgi:hypothetical protein
MNLNNPMKLSRWIFVIPLILLISCGPAPEATTLTAPAYSAVTSEPVHTMPASPTADATLAPLLVIQTDGLAGFRDQLAVADQFFVTLTDVPPPPGGQAYQGWLLGDDGTIVSVGMLALAPDGNATFIWNSPNSENLLSRYVRFQVTLEPEAGNASPTGKVVFAGGLEGAALTNARRLLVKNDGEPATPLNTAYALGLLAQTDIAAQHIQNASNAAAIGAQAEMRAHLEHIVNILEGMSGPRYSDHDGNGTAENPGDGFGVIGYSGQIAAMPAGQETVVETNTAIQAQSVAIQDKCLEIINLTDLAAVTVQLPEAEKLINQLQTVLVARLYQAVQDSIRFEVAPTE